MPNRKWTPFVIHHHHVIPVESWKQPQQEPIAMAPKKGCVNFRPSENSVIIVALRWNKFADVKNFCYTMMIKHMKVWKIQSFLSHCITYITGTQNSKYIHIFHILFLLWHMTFHLPTKRTLPAFHDSRTICTRWLVDSFPGHLSLRFELHAFLTFKGVSNKWPKSRMYRLIIGL